MIAASEAPSLIAGRGRDVVLVVSVDTARDKGPGALRAIMSRA